jgi:hypothetical protein
MANFNKYYCTVDDLCRAKHDWANHVLKAFLTNTAPDANNHIGLANATEITRANNYNNTTISQNISQTGGVESLKAVSVTFTAAGGNFGPFRYVGIFNDNTTSPADALVGWWDYGSSISCNNGESFTWATPANNLIANLT